MNNMPPTLDEIKAAGYSEQAAAAIFAEEQAKFAAGEPPYDKANPPAEPSVMSAHATAPAVSESLPTVGDLDAMAAEEAAKHATAAPPSIDQGPSHRKATPGGPINPSYDADKFDSLGKQAKEDGPEGPRGKNSPADVMTDDERAAVAQKEQDRLAQGMAPTDKIDARGDLKGHFEVAPQGLDKHGARIPDKIDYSKPVEEPPAHVGPRGVGAPPDSFHGPKPTK